MEKKSLILLVISALFVFATSCDNDSHATDGRSPQFESLTLTPSTVNAGDSVVANVSYTYPGKKIYSSIYNETYEWKVVDPTKSTPTYKFRSPDEAGIYTVTFRARQINYSSGGPNGELYGSANSVSATLRVQ